MTDANQIVRENDNLKRTLKATQFILGQMIARMDLDDTAAADAERERCALICEDLAKHARANGAGGEPMALACADRIRVSKLTTERLQACLAEGRPVRSTSVTTDPKRNPAHKPE